MNITRQFEFKLPTFMLSAVINNDEDGLDDDDLKILKTANGKFMELANGLDWVISYTDDQYMPEYFSLQPDFCSLACNVVDITLNIFCEHPTGSIETKVVEIKRQELVKIRHIETCDKCEKILSVFLETFKFASIEELEN